MIQRIANIAMILLVVAFIALGARALHLSKRASTFERVPQDFPRVIAKAIKAADPDTPVGVHCFGKGDEIYLTIIYQAKAIRVDKFYKLDRSSTFQEISLEYKGQENGIWIQNKFFPRLLSLNVH